MYVYSVVHTPSSSVHVSDSEYLVPSQVLVVPSGIRPTFPGGEQCGSSLYASDDTVFFQVVAGHQTFGMREVW